MLSIITSIHNQLAINRLFYESLIKNTTNDFELIIIDNASNDGSTEFFQSKKEVVFVRNEQNFNYPYCQNQGLQIAKFDLVCFFNNDIIVSSRWDEKVLCFSATHPDVEVFSVATNDHIESKPAQKRLNRRWKRIKYPLKFVLGVNNFSLRLMMKLMYGDFAAFCRKRFDIWGYQHIEGYSGSAIIGTRKGLRKTGSWDERIQAGDFDLFNRVKERSLSVGDIRPIQLILGVYFHHFQRMTLKSKYPPFQNKDQMISIDDKWGNKTKKLRKDILG